MQLSRKFQKLFSFDAAESLWEHACRWTHPVNARRILATLDEAELARLREHYPYRPNARKINAYENAAYWIGINVEHAQDLWLDRSPPLRILDLGCGAGYFLYICRLFGHEGLGLDTDEEPLFRGTTKLLNVRRVVSRIHPQVPLPDLGEKFDLVTAHRVCFHRISARGKRRVDRMDARRLGIFHQRYPNAISETGRSPAPRFQSASRRLFIFYKRTACLFPIRRCADLSFKSAARSGSDSTSTIQTDKNVGKLRFLASGPAQRVVPTTYNFQSEQSQPSICSSFAMSSAKRL